MLGETKFVKRAIESSVQSKKNIKELSLKKRAKQTSQLSSHTKRFHKKGKTLKAISRDSTATALYAHAKKNFGASTPNNELESALALLNKRDRLEVELAWVKIDGNYFRGLRGTIKASDTVTVYDPTIKKDRCYYRVTLYGGDRLRSSYPALTLIPVAQETAVMISLDGISIGEKRITLLRKYSPEAEKTKLSCLSDALSQANRDERGVLSQPPAIAAFPASEFQSLQRDLESESEKIDISENKDQMNDALGRFSEALKAKQEGRDLSSLINFKAGEAVQVREITLNQANYENVKKEERKTSFASLQCSSSDESTAASYELEVRRFSNLMATVIGFDPSGKYLVKLHHADIDQPDFVFHIKEQSAWVEPMQLFDPSQIVQKDKTDQKVQIKSKKIDEVGAVGSKREVAGFNSLLIGDFKTGESVILISTFSETRVEIDPGIFRPTYKDFACKGIRGKIVKRNQNGSYKVKIESQKVRFYDKDDVEVVEQTVDFHRRELARFDGKSAFEQLAERVKKVNEHLSEKSPSLKNTEKSLEKVKEGLIQAKDGVAQAGTTVTNELEKTAEVVTSSLDKGLINPFKKIGEFWRKKLF